jgi:sulfur-oxidizing protein SoxX
MRTEALLRKVAAVFLLLGAGSAGTEEGRKLDPVKLDAVIRTAFPTASAEWQSRLIPDETMRACAMHRNVPPKGVTEAIVQRAKAAIPYPLDNKLLGDWKKGEAIAQSGYGLRFTDYPPRSPNGGNCYACHRLTRQELSYGTLGPPLLEYGKVRGFSEADAKAAYEKVYDAQASIACSNMPRFGANRILTIEQIKDLVALLMSPESPVNK